MKIDKVVVGELRTNCYLISKNDQCIIIDPGDEYEKIKNFISNKKIVGVIVTHYHFDHIGALKFFNKSLILDKNNLDEKIYKIGDFEFEVIYTPGHKEDAITIYFYEEKIMFTGDFIFKSAIGRTDLDGGNMLDMVSSLNKMKRYDGNIIIYPGHGDETILMNELY